MPPRLIVATLLLGFCGLEVACVATHADSLARLEVQTRSGAEQQSSPPPKAAQQQGGVRFELVSAAVHQFDTQVESGGDYSVSSYFLEPRVNWGVSQELSLSFNVSGRFDDFSFGGSTGLPSTRPWNKIRTVGVSGMVRWRFEQRWTLFAVPLLRASAEEGADLGDAKSGGGMIGTAYYFGDKLTLGPGIGYITQLEDTASVFPVLLINWKLADDLTLKTGSGIAATQGPGLALAWAFADEWEATLGGRYESLRFRLDDKGIAPGGVGEVESYPFYGAVTHTWSSGSRLGLFGGIDVAGRLRLDPRNGPRIASEGYDPAASIGLVVELKF